MAAKDFCELRLEETPIPEGAVKTATPYRLASEKLYLPARSAQLVPGVQLLDRGDELRNISGAVPRLVDGYEVSGSISERCYLKDLVWLLSLAGFAGTYTAGDGIILDPDGVAIPAGCARWEFTKRDAIVAQTAQMLLNYATEDVLLTANGVGVSQVALNAAGELSADLIGMVLAQAAADTTTSPAVAASTIPPVRRGDLYLSWLAGGGTISDFNIQIANALERINSLSKLVPSYFPDVLEQGDEQVQVTGSVPKRVLDGTDLAALLAATSFAAKARWITPKTIGATVYKYSLWIEMPSCQLVSGSPDELGNKRRHGASYDFFAAYDEALGYDAKITVVNDVVSLATWTAT
jgi:hypothetical protein